MLFGEKLSDAENSSKRINSASHVDPFSFSALHFLRNRLMPNGKKKSVLIQFKYLNVPLPLIKMTQKHGRSSILKDFT